jgi:hypothetical protein
MPQCTPTQQNNKKCKEKKYYFEADFSGGALEIIR